VAQLIKKSELDYKNLSYFFDALRIIRIIKEIKNAKVKNPKIIASTPKKFLSKSLEEKKYKRREAMKIIKNRIRFFHARPILSLRRAGPLTDLAVVFFAPTLFFLTI
jgi:hypothetical protein